MVFAMKGAGGSRGGLECNIPILKNDFFKNHLESFPDCENVRKKEKKWGKKMSGNLCHQGGGGGRRLMAKTILNFHFDYLTTSLTNLVQQLTLEEEMNVSNSIHISYIVSCGAV